MITGPDATALFIDSRKVQREGAMPSHIQTLFGGHALPVLDGDTHRERKHFIMAGFTREAIAWYVPTLHRLTADYFLRWARSEEVLWGDQMEKLALESIGETLMGIPPGPLMDELRGLYAIFFRGFAALPIPLPATAFSRAKRALRRILEIHRANVDAHLKEPRGDGLSRILAAKSPLSGGPPAPEDIARELHHLVIAGLIVRGWFATLMLELQNHADIRQRLTDEIMNVAPDGPLSLERLEAMPYLEQVTSEVRRLSPVVHVFFGKARETIEFAGHTIPEGWSVFWGIRTSHLDADVYPDPLRFDPERFSAGARRAPAPPVRVRAQRRRRTDGPQVRRLRAGAADAEGVRGRAAARLRLAARRWARPGAGMEPGSADAQGWAARSGDAAGRAAGRGGPRSVTLRRGSPHRAWACGGARLAQPPCGSSTGAGCGTETTLLSETLGL